MMVETADVPLTQRMNADIFCHQLQDAADLNRDAVAALSQPGTISGLTAALNGLKRSLRILQNLSREIRGPDRFSLPAGGLIYSAGQMPMPDNDLLYIYGQPKVFYPGGIEDASLGRLTAFTAAVVFNTALAYHRKALETGRTNHYKSAHLLYGSVLRLFTTQPLNLQENTDFMILYVASANNMAQVDYELSEYKSFEMTMQQLVMPATQNMLQRQSILADDEAFSLNEVAMNVLLAKSPELARAA